MTDKERIEELEKQVEKQRQIIRDLEEEEDRNSYIASWKPQETNIFGM